MKKLFLLALLLLLNTSIVLADPDWAKLCSDPNHPESGDFTSHCESYALDVDAHHREIALNKITAKWTVEQKNAFTLFTKAAYDYFDQHAGLEVEHSGTDPMINEYQEQTTLRNNFIKNIKLFEEGHFPIFSSDDFKKSDAALNKIYQGFMKDTYAAIKSGNAFCCGGTSCYDEDSCGITGVKDTEKAWIKYRDAWVTFAAIRYPTVSADSWKTWLTQERIKQLDDIRSQVFVRT